MKILFVTLITIISFNAKAADFTVEIVPAPLSISDSHVNIISTSKISGLAEIVPPAGSIMMYAGSSAPTGWRFTNGDSISKTTYPALFDAIGYTYGGSGDTFNLPNTSGLFVRSTGTQSVFGVTYSGSSLGGKQTDQFQGHHHINRRTSDNATVGLTMEGGNGSWYSPGSAGAGGSHARDIITDGTNGSPRIGSETRPASISFNYIIKM